MSPTAVQCKNLTKSFAQALAVDGVDLELEKGNFLALLGPSGCGKTTLLRLVAGFETPDRGAVEVAERVVVAPGVFIPPEKRRVGIVFQDYAIFPHLSVAGNIAYGLPRRSDRHTQVEEMLSLVGLQGLESRMPHELSGGEQQRVALARALAPGPEVLLMDEPFSNLDADLRSRIRVEVKSILARAGATVIFVTHDQEEAMYFGDRVGVMNRGRLEQISTPEDIFHRPATSFVAQFIGIADFIPGLIRDGVVDTEIGNLPVLQKPAKNGAVSVMIRPDFVDLEPSSDGAGVVADRVFQGMHYLYRVQLPSGASIRSLQHHTLSYPMGTRVTLRMNPEHAVTCFAEPAGSEQ